MNFYMILNMKDEICCGVKISLNQRKYVIYLIAHILEGDVGGSPHCDFYEKREKK